MQEVAEGDTLATSATDVDRALVTGFNTIPVYVDNSAAEYRIMKMLANVAGDTSVLPLGVSAESEEAVLSRHRVLAAIGMAEAAMGQTYGYVDEALAAKDAVLAVLSDEAQAAYDVCDNPLFLELRKYATQFAQMMDDLTYRLPGLVAVNFMGGVHPLVAAYAIYNDATRHRDLELRNRVDANGRFDPVVFGVTPV